MKKTITIEHLARVEGHGGITVVLEGDAITDIRFDVFEGARLIEGLVAGRPWRDVPQIVSRICSICSVAHSLTSVKAIENGLGVKVTPQTQLLRDLLFRGESIESHSLHIFLLALPDYLGYPSAIAMAQDHPEAVTLGLRLKRLGNAIQEALGGRAVHPVNAVVGGFGRPPSVDRLLAVRDGLEAAVRDSDAMIDLLAGLPAQDFCHAETVFAALDGGAEYGYYLGDEIRVSSQEVLPVARYRSLTNETAVVHSTAKHSRYRRAPFLVGSLARLTLNGHRIGGRAASAMTALGLRLPSDNPLDNNKAQAVELVWDVDCALRAVEGILRTGLGEEEPVKAVPRAGTGTAATEAPRGTLYHSYTFDDRGTVTSADIITPTAQNLSCAEGHFHTAIVQSADRSPSVLGKKLEMIARSYDPCISCSVHLVTT